MKPLFPVVVIKSARIIFNKAVCLNLALVMLFNLASPVFANINQNKKEELLFQELNQELQEQHNKQKASPMQRAFELCVKNNDKSACDKYIAEVNKMFTDTAEETTKGKEVKEEVFTPFSKKDYTKKLKENIQEEFASNSKEMTLEYDKQRQILQQQYKDVIISSPQYPNYIAAKTALDNWHKENLKSLNDWQQEVLASSADLYKDYLSEFERNVEEYKQEKEKALTEFLRELASDTMTVYQKASDKSKLKLVPVFVYLLSMESKEANLLTSAQKSEIYKFFNKVISPADKSNPCAYHTRNRKANELSIYNAWQEQLNRIEEQTSKTPSARDQVAAQTRGYQERISNDLRAPITELVNEGVCHAAMSALTGLSYFKGWDMSQVAMFMTKNAMEPMASEVLLMATNTLMEANRVDAFSILAQYMVDMEMTYEGTDDLKLKESFFYDGRFYKTPYITSRYTEQDGGGDVWQDIAKMLSNKKTLLANKYSRIFLTVQFIFQ